MEEFSFQAFVEAFEGVDIVCINYRGNPAWIAKDIGRALEYGSDGRALVTAITKEWATEFQAGTHHEVITGRDRKDFLDLLEVVRSNLTTSDEVGSADPLASLKFAPSIMLLREPGIWGVLLRTDKPVGQRLRRWLETTCMPRMIRGEAVVLDGAPAATPQIETDAPPREQRPQSDIERMREERRRLEVQHRTRLESRYARSEAIRRTAAELLELGVIDKGAYAMELVRAGEIEAGRKLPELRQAVTRGPVTRSPQQVEAPSTAPALPAPAKPAANMGPLRPAPKGRGSAPNPNQFEFRLVPAKKRETAAGSGRTLSEHQVKGHRRKQPCGPNRGLIREVWVKPHVRGGDGPAAGSGVDCE